MAEWGPLKFQLVVFQESHPNRVINRCSQNAGYILNCYGLEPLKTIGSNTISSSGSVMGTRNAIAAYVSKAITALKIIALHYITGCFIVQNNAFAVIFRRMFVFQVTYMLYVQNICFYFSLCFVLFCFDQGVLHHPATGPVHAIGWKQQRANGEQELPRARCGPGLP